MPSLLRKKGGPDTGVAAALRYLQRFVDPVDPEFYGLLEGEARQRLRGRDEDDWPILATALVLSCPVWTEDADFFGTGAAVWTTNRVEIYLKAQAESSVEEES